MSMPSPPANPSNWQQRMRPLANPPREHVRFRRMVRHPRELLMLCLAIAGSCALLVGAFAEIIVAENQERDPSIYAYALIFGPLLVWFARGQLWATQRLRGIKLTPNQFPEAYDMLVDAAQRAGMGYVPDAYVVLGNGAINAGASGHAFRRYVMVHSDLLEVGGAARDPDALRFIIAHEIGHIAAGHTSYWRMLATFAAGWIPFLGSTLSRSQEYTADNYGIALHAVGARPAMAVLAGGKYLVRTVDVDTMADRAVSEGGLFTWVVNALASHPVLLWRAHALRDRRRPGRLLWRPREPWLWSREVRPEGFRLPATIGFEPVEPEVVPAVVTHAEPTPLEQPSRSS